MKKKAKKSKAKPKKKLKVKAKAKPKAKKAKPAKKPAFKAKTKAKTKSKKSRAKKPQLSVVPPANSVLLGRVEDYYSHVGVITLTLLSGVRLGDHIHVLGHTTNLEQTVDSMQIDHESISEASAKDGVGIKITSRARHGDYVFRIKE